MLLRLIILVGGALLALVGSDLIHLKVTLRYTLTINVSHLFIYFTLLQGSGALAILVMAFTAGTAWRKQGWGDSNPVTETLASLWVFFQPLLFSLIGAEVN